MAETTGVSLFIQQLKKMSITTLILIFVLQINGAGNRTTCSLNSFPGYTGKSVGISLVSPEETKLHFNCNGVLNQIYVHKGNAFKKGQLLASLKYEDVNLPIMSVIFYLDKAKESYVIVKAQVEKKTQPASQLKLAKKNLDDAEASYEKSLTAEQNYYLTASANGLVVDEVVKAGDQVSAGETILTVKWR